MTSTTTTKTKTAKTAAKKAAPAKATKKAAAPADPGKVKTVKAKNLPTRVAIAWAGTKATPLAKPVHATAYARGEQTTVALSNGQHQTVDGETMVRYAPDAVAAKATGLRWCKGGPENKNADGTLVCPTPHLKRIGSDRAATAYCDTMLAWYRANPLTLEEYRAQQEARKAQRIAERAGVTMAPEPTEEQKAEGAARAAAALTGEQEG